MDIIDDDFQSVLPSPALSPEVQFRRLKRLKKSGYIPLLDPIPGAVDDPVLFTHIDFAKQEALENDSELPDSGDSNAATYEAILSEEELSDGFEEDEENSSEFENCDAGKKARRVLDFGDDSMVGFEGEEKLGEIDGHCLDPENKNGDGVDENRAQFSETETKKKKKKGKEITSEGEGRKRERKSNLKELHAETQRLLRETRDASFKPVPIIQKPISSVLEKIRRRKLEVLKKFCGSERNCVSPDRPSDLNGSDEEGARERAEGTVHEETVVPSVVVEPLAKEITSDFSSRGFTETCEQSVSEGDQNQMDSHDDLEWKGAAIDSKDGEQISPLEEDHSSTLHTINQNFDSGSMDDSSSDEEYMDKENIDPGPGVAIDSATLTGYDPVKDFLDEEAEEEYDSDNDLQYTRANEDEENIEDAEELNDIIATQCEEGPVDKEMRHALHQKWLERQDAMETDNVLQKLKCKSVLRDTFLHEDESESDQNEDEFDDDDEVEEDDIPCKPSRISSKKAKEIVLEMLADKEDPYFSDDDDDHSMKRSLALRLFNNKEKQSDLVSLDDRGNAREVLGLIKNLNIVPTNKKKPKELFFFDSVLKGRNTNNSSKSSFIGRVSSHPMPSFRPGSGKARPFIFSRDDSNSRSTSIDASTDTIVEEPKTARHTTAKYSSSSQTKSHSNTFTETASEASLLEILKQSSKQPSFGNKEDSSSIDLTKGIFAFRVTKKMKTR